MAKGKRVGNLLERAGVEEKSYNWVKAAKLYEQAAKSFLGKKMVNKSADIREQMGFCFYRAALQAETHREFRSRMKLAIRAYERAAELSEKTEEEGKRAKINHSKAIAAYASSWLATDPSKKRELLEDCWRLGKEVLKDYEEAGDSLGYGKVCNELLEISSIYRLWLVLDWPELEGIIEEALDFGEKAIVALSEVGDDYELARAYCWTSWHYGYAVWFRALKEKREEFGQKCLSYSKNALKLSEKIGDPYLISILNSSAGQGTFTCAGNLHSARKFFEDQQKQGAIVKDNYLTGTAATWLALTTWLIMMRLEEDPDKRREGYKKTTEYAEDALQHLRIIAYSPYIVLTYYYYTESFTRLADIETDLEAKRVLLERAVEVGREGLGDAEGSGVPFSTKLVFNALSIALHWLSNMETKVNEKRRLLEEALEKREKAIRIEQRVTPFDYFFRGLSQSYRALTEAELAKIETNKRKKRKLLEKAVSSMENCLKLCGKDVEEHLQLWKLSNLGRYHYWFGRILNQLYLLTEDESVLRRAIEVYNGSVKMYGKVEQPSRMAESHWEIAKLHDRLGDHSKAAHNYEYAAEKYRLATEKIPQLKEFYEDYSFYMQGWSEMEKARHSHARERYDQAREHYEKAANLHKSSKPWSYLAPNYSAWAQLEKAEDLSRKEKTQEAIQTFQEALELFNKAKGSIQIEIKEIQATDEREMATELIKASDIRRRYCQARTNLEEAKILDRKGEHALSSKRYGSAAETLRRIIEEIEFEPARKELRPIMCLCQAWQKMALAEEKTSPELYLEASQLFEEAKEHSLNKRTSLLALGNSSFCKALAAGTKFDITLDTAMHSMAKQHIERATICYLKAGFKSASEYAKATQRVFDAYTYMNNAEKETDPEKRAKYYQMTEKLLQTSAESYMKAKHPEKSAEVQRILENVREERKLAASLSEVLHAPPIASTTASFTTPTPSHENSVGLERFEQANIQAQLIVPEEVTVGEDLTVQLDLVNVGKNSGLLVRVDNLVPKGFKVTEAPRQYTMEDELLDMGGKRLEPLKVESIKISARAADAGVFELSPQVVYVDEAGQFRTCRPEGVRVMVHPTLAFRFRTKTAQNVFDYLTKAFVEDYMRRRLSLEKSGWRSLMQIVKDARVSKYSLYGSRGRRGPAMSELERRGLVEARVFPEERGRGGEIVKTRISYEKETVKRYVDKQVMKNAEK
ncbi:MAG: tetratricopeptide repeat protein [Candidatus Bathyarchaeia archaeon]